MALLFEHCTQAGYTIDVASDWRVVIGDYDHELKKLVPGDRRVKYSRPSRIAGPGYLPENGVIIECKYHHAGSPVPAFGLTEDDSREWPAISLRMGFPQGKERTRDLLAEKLMTMIDRFLKEHNLEA